MEANQKENCAKYKHPLIHNGTHQKDRIAKELLPENIQLDNRDTKAFLSFAYEYAALIKYVDTDNTVNGNWQCFFNGGILGILSIITAIDLEAIEDSYCRTELEFWKAIDNAEEADKEAVRKQQYQALLNHIFSLAQKIDTICKDLPLQFGLKEEISSFIKQDIGNAVFQNKFQNLLKILISYDKGNQQRDDKGNLPGLEFKYDTFIASNNNNSTCTKLWGIGNIDDFFCISADDGFIEIQDPDQCKENRILREVFFAFFQVLSKIVKRAGTYLETELSDSHAQEPQISLFLAFIFLFRRLLKQLDQITERHLDFYYEKVLCLPYKAFTPDQVFVFFELAKNFNEFQLNEGTLLDAKKDSEGNKMEYTIDEELIINSATVVACQAIYLDGNDLKTFNLNTQKSEKGNRPIDWRKLNNSQEIGEVGIALSDPILSMQEGTRFIVIKIAHEEGNKIDLGDYSDGVNVSISSDLSENGWLTITKAVDFDTLNKKNVPLINKGLVNNIYTDLATTNYIVSLKENVLEIRIVLKDNGFPVNVPKIDSLLFSSVKHPILKVTFNEQLQKALKIKSVKNYTITTDVRNIKSNILTRNQLGVYSNESTFPLLGIAYPQLNGQTSITNGAYIEFEIEELKGKQVLGLQPRPIFTKLTDKQTEIQPTDFVNLFTPEFKVINTVSKYSDFTSDSGGPHILEGNDFVVNLNQPKELQPSRDRSTVTIGNDNVIFDNSTPQTYTNPSVYANTQLNPALVNYFQNANNYATNFQNISSTTRIANAFAKKNIKIKKSYSVYSSIRNKNILSLKYDETKKSKNIDFKKETIQVKGVNFRYAALASFLENSNNIIYRKKEFERYYITPTGYNVINPSELDNTVSLLPNNYLKRPTGSELDGVAHLEIGIKDLVPGQLLSLLFQMEQGSGNTNYDPPTIQWSFLAKDVDGISDEWIPFVDGAIYNDSTKTDQNSNFSLLQTGIIRFVTDPRMTNQGTSIQPSSGLFWIRASFLEQENKAPQKCQRIIALPNIMAINANATTATFSNQQNSLNHIKAGLPIDTISKLSNQVSAIKTVIQPLPSFNGRKAEDRNAYYRRISERLRHKNRAINIWDYERLILEAFPEVSHAKVITHASKNCMISPGKVLVIVFPDIKNRNDINPFIPKFNIGKLEEIEDFLRARANLFLVCGENIQVINPDYELIQVDSCIRFKQGFSPPFYASRLNNELHTYLAPWIEDNQINLHFSGQLHTSNILNFIEERPYVDVISNFKVKLYTLDTDTLEPVFDNVKEIPVLLEASSTKSLFTTFPSGHEIKLWGSAGCDGCKATVATNFQLCMD